MKDVQLKMGQSEKMLPQNHKNHLKKTIKMYRLK